MVIKPFISEVLQSSKSIVMKKYILLFVIALVAIAGQSQNTTSAPVAKKEVKSPDERASQRTKKMTEKYQLNEAQSNRLLEVNRQHAQENESFRKQNEQDKAERKTRRENRKAAQSRYMEQVKTILTAEQYAAFEKDMAEQKSKRQAARKARKEAH
ncbi:MAG: hypothetical protein RLZZ262_2158 [Bacteroidota bacterium]|jgi:LAS superfamily LD-carboxypeptidase LdcB